MKLSLPTRLTRLLFSATLIVSVTWAQNPAPAETNDALVPVTNPGHPQFHELHASFLARAQAGPIGLLFLGDSITYGWRKAPHIWEHYFGKYQPANFGIGGDRTQHVIWRIENGELDGIAPAVVVLMLGTNNTGTNTAAEIVAGNRRIVALIQEKLPDAKILLLGIFPRGPRWARNGNPDPWEEKMAIIRDVNTELARWDDGQRIRYLNLTRAFLGNDGDIPNIIMPDQLHPNAAGYQLWAEAMLPLLEEMMQEPDAPAAGN
ncbi:MAG: GDSL family lipase [Cephaloticoccus sp.]|nr:GDSL family lipase [Cephaloticoccus sp.]